MKKHTKTKSNNINKRQTIKPFYQGGKGVYVSGIALTFFGLSRITGKTELAITHHVNE